MLPTDALQPYLKVVQHEVVSRPPSRALLVRWVLSPARVRGSLEPTHGWIVCDENSGKANSAIELLGVKMIAVNPMDCPRSRTLRMIALRGLFYSSKRREVLWASLVSSSFCTWYTKYHSLNGRVFLWNPYHLIHYAVAARGAVTASYHLTCGYPRLPSVTFVFGSELGLKVLGYGSSVQSVIVGPRVNRLFQCDRPSAGRLVICLSKFEIQRTCPSERFLLLVAEEVNRSMSAEVVVYLHPNDLREPSQLEIAEKELAARGMKGSRAGYLNEVCAGDVSLSAMSTIGIELVSRGMTHRVVAVGDPHQSEIHGDWRFRGLGELVARGAVFDMRAGVSAIADRLVALLGSNDGRSIGSGGQRSGSPPNDVVEGSP